MHVYVRAKKDKALLDYVNEKVYNNDLKIFTFKGKRKEDLQEDIENIIKNPNDFTIILLGSEDKKWIDIKSSPIVKVYFVPKKKVRNTKPRAIVKELEMAKSKFILDIFYDKAKNTYILGKDSNILPSLIPGTDIFLGTYEKFKDIISNFLIINNYPLIWHVRSVDYLFMPNKINAKIERSLHGPLRFEQIDNNIADIDINKLYDINYSYLKAKEEITIQKIKNILDDLEHDKIIVPWSGGKDSTLLVHLLKKYKIDFVAIYVDTGLEFNTTKEFIEAFSRKYGIPLETAYAEIDKMYKRFGYRYLLERKCTQLKITSLYNIVEKLADNPILIVGDRISESESRSYRPELRKDKYYVFSPIKYWSFLDEQLYFKVNNIEINPLYDYGFYRVGCYNCPFIDSFEKFIISKKIKTK